MSVDFYVAVPASEWPTAVAFEQCASREGYPINVRRFPTIDAKKVVTDGATVFVDGRDTYLEGDLSPASLSGEEVRAINERLEASASAFRISDQHVLMSFRVRSPNEVRAASYVIAGLVVCFGGYGFDPQGNTHGRADFAKSLTDGAALLKEVMSGSPTDQTFKPRLKTRPARPNIASELHESNPAAEEPGQ